MAATVIDRQGPRSTNTYCSNRTKAMPKQTLFGSSLQMNTDAEKAEIQDRDLQAFEYERQSQRVARQNRYKAMLPENMKKSLPVNETVEYSRNELSKQLSQASAAKQTLESLEKSSLYFQLGQHGGPRVTTQELSSAPQNTDNNLTRVLNAKIPGSTQSNQYALQGDSFRPDVGHRVADQQQSSHADLQKPGPYGYKRHKAPDWLPKEYFMNRPRPEPVVTSVDLPPNIQHQFGTNVCSSVLASQDKVDKAIQERQQRHHAYHHRLRGRVKVSSPDLTNDIDPMYESLGNALRQDMFPGLTRDHTVSVAHSVYTDDIHRRRLQDPDKWRYQRDELSTWAEQNVLRERMKKAWDIYLSETMQKKAEGMWVEQDVIKRRLAKKWQEYEDSRPQFQPNWDRGAKRSHPPPPTQISPAKPKHRNNNTKKTKKDDSLAKPPSSPFEDVVFKTPPLSPPPSKPDLVKKPSFTRDDAFWDFYDQQVPT